MKLRNKFIPAVLFFGVVALSSCEKQEHESMDPVMEQGVISHILADSAEVTSYNFAGKQLSQINHYNVETGDLESFEKYERDSKGKVVKSTMHGAGTHALLSEQVYHYNTNNRLVKTEMSYYNGSKVEYQGFATYEYDAKNYLEKKTVFEGTDNEKAAVKSYTLYEVLPNGNYAQEKQFIIDDKSDAKLFSTTTYSYDSSVNPFHELAEPGTASSPNNLVAAVTEVHNSKKTYKYNYTYTYDERGYPLTQAVASPNGKNQTYKYLYSN
ncbi:hypothetical protein [Pontibacter rugosus]|uniref:YD repeat-containing protein n=1 Tax=Pontibacter rugosus TaxID=1745966 RepID=A0ABW3STP8_9BACT